MSTSLPQAPADSQAWWVSGNFAPVVEERTEHRLEVSGAIPPELRGRFFRNGSNPQSGASLHWFLGNGMIHGVELRDGRATWYRNRYVRTPLFLDPGGDGLTPEGTPDRTRSLANTHVIAHAGRILALEEGHLPFEVTRELDTVGPHDFGGKLATAMTAHPRVCPVTGELLFFGYGAVPPYLTYHRVAADGRLVQSEEIEVPGPTMMHDWNVTRNHVVFMDLPMVFDLELLQKGGMPIRWDDAYGARLGVMPRDGTNADVVWYEIEPCYVFHPMNAYEDGDRIVIDVARFPRFEMAGEGDAKPAVLHRWIIDRAAGKVVEQPIDDRPADFPRVPDAVTGLRHRYGYMMSTGERGPETFGERLYKYDLSSGRSWTHELGAGMQAGEPVPAAVPGARGEDEGYLLTFVYDRSTDRSDLLILDASRFDAAPVARVHLPCRVPNGFHGSWIADGS
jgi:carotenoid cleavage dioxygenase